MMDPGEGPSGQTLAGERVRFRGERYVRLPGLGAQGPDCMSCSGVSV